MGPIKILGVNKRYYPTAGDGVMGFNEDPPPVVAVLVAGDIGDYACYVGLGEPIWVAQHGNKICFQEAVVQFPTIEKENYRE
jgi:hypothetical protein